MSDFRLAIPTVFLHEGRYVKHPADPGGATDWGISLRFLRNTGDLDNDGFLDGDINHDHNIDERDIRALCHEEAEKLYRIYFWEPQGYQKIADQLVATKLFDFSVNMGSRMANILCQRSVRSAIGINLTEDGILGVKSLHAINLANPVKLVPALKSEAAGFYRLLAERKPKLGKFTKGWLNRAYSDPVITSTTV